ncbi:MAG: CHASE2 domain-containing protein [Deltaproteobacteria bacterium]|nr:MAG: CHASE2 domain-containing protein [Deltaproteobacteria bacterium]
MTDRSEPGASRSEDLAPEAMTSPWLPVPTGPGERIRRVLRRLAAAVTVRALLVAFFSVLVALGPTGAGPLQRADVWLYDRLLRPLIPAPSVRDDIVVVRVDDRTLEDLNERWPLSRATWARFVERIEAWRPALVVLDVVFDQPDETSAVPFGERVLDEIEGLGLAATPSGKKLHAFVSDELVRLDADVVLSRAMANAGNVVLGAFFTQSSGALVPDAPQRIPPVARGDYDLVLTASEAVTSHPRFTVAALTSGAMNVLVDADGSVRRYPYAVALGDDVYASLALAAATSATRDAAEARRIVQRALAADGGAPFLRFRPEGRPFPELSFSDLLLAPAEQGPDAAVLAGKIVFVGATALGIEDQLRTPIGYRTPGVIVHATATENLLEGSFLVAGGLAHALSVLETLLLLGLMAWWMARRPRPLGVLAAGGGALVVHGGVVVGAAFGPGLLLEPVAVPLGLISLGALELGVRWRLVRHEREQLAERERVLAAERDALTRFRQVVDNVGDAIVTVDDDRRVTWMNPAAETLFMRRSRSTLGRSIDALVPAWAAGLPQTARDANRRGATAREEEVVLPNGETVPVEVTVTPMATAAGVRQNCVFRDIAARKAVERMKDELVSTVNHELRTPVTSILGSLKLVKGGVGGAVEPAALQLVDIAVQNGERLLGLVNDLLDLAKLEAGGVEYDTEPVAIGPLVAEAVEANRGYGASFSVHLVLAVDVEEARVRGNARRLGQVVTNLVSNAVKYSPPDGVVQVRVTEVAGGRVRVAVADRGPGIPLAFRAHIFDKFATTIAGDGKKRPGTGLGLAIAKRIVEEHGGAIGFDTELEVGTTFWFELPELL